MSCISLFLSLFLSPTPAQWTSALLAAHLPKTSPQHSAPGPVPRSVLLFKGHKDSQLPGKHPHPFSMAGISEQFASMCIEFILQSTNWPGLNWWWREAREGDLFPELSCVLLMLLTQPEFSSCGVCGSSCWAGWLLMSLSNCRKCFFFVSRKRI